MSNILLAWQNWADQAVISSAGSWEVDLPLANMQDHSLAMVARSSTAFFFDTTFNIDLGAPRLINLIGLINHNISPEAFLNISIYSDSGFSVPLYQAFSVPVSPVVWTYETGALWGVNSVWTGKYSAEELGNINWNLFHMVPGTIVAQYVRVDIFDQANVNGYVDIARLFIGPTWEVSYNYNVGGALGWRDLSVVDEGLSGTIFSEQRTKKRTFAFDFSFLSKNEAFGKAFELQRQQGVTKEIIVIPSPDDPIHQFRESFMGRLTTLSPIQIRQAGLHDVGFNIEELT